MPRPSTERSPRWQVIADGYAILPLLQLFRRTRWTLDLGIFLDSTTVRFCVPVYRITYIITLYIIRHTLYIITYIITLVCIPFRRRRKTNLLSNKNHVVWFQKKKFQVDQLNRRGTLFNQSL